MQASLNNIPGPVGMMICCLYITQCHVTAVQMFHLYIEVCNCVPLQPRTYNHQCVCNLLGVGHRSGESCCMLILCISPPQLRIYSLRSHCCFQSTGPWGTEVEMAVICLYYVFMPLQPRTCSLWCPCYHQSTGWWPLKWARLSMATHSLVATSTGSPRSLSPQVLSQRYIPSEMCLQVRFVNYNFVISCKMSNMLKIVFIDHWSSLDLSKLFLK